MHSGAQFYSAAAFIVKSAAERVEDFDPTFLLKQLEEEKIREDWQLEFLDAQQWQILGAPMGLVAAIRRILAEREKLLQHSSSPPIAIDISLRSSLMEQSQRDSIAFPLRSSIIPPEDSESLDFFSSSPRVPPAIVSRSRSAVPPIMPQRRQSQCLIWQHGEDETSNGLPEEVFGQWLGKNTNAPPVKPTRLSSVTVLGSSRSLDASCDDYDYDEDDGN